LADGAVSAAVETVRDLLASRRALFDPFLRAAVGEMPSGVRRIASYHLGWVDHDGRQVVANPGKAIRPTLALVAAEAVGSTALEALPAAAAVELVHNFSLIHDDVIDRDITRRHRPTAWTEFGVGPALCAGSALFALAFDVLAASGHHAAQGVATMLSEAVLGLLEGQSQDLAFECRTDVDLSECLGMVERKTGLLIGCACAAGAAFGGGQPAQVERLRSFGRHLGFAFQLVDDLLGIWGDPALTGKPVGSDLQNRKKTLPVVWALSSGTSAAGELAALYEGETVLSEGELARAARLIEKAGARQWCDAQLEVFVSRALQDLELARPTDRAAVELRSLALFTAWQYR
jgi:geranylgeranyl diphosphate synthase type I